ncbi:MAG TPA: hypothetical protein VFJ72_05445 [Rubrobacteraceae bacterium]|nr:hypothetical protein [Rubrobacteraceae bacterium]
MNHQMRLLYTLIAVIPIVVAGAGLAAFLLLRAGYGPLVWGVLPFLAMLALAGIIGAVLGRAATNRRVPRDDRPPRDTDRDTDQKRADDDV